MKNKQRKSLTNFIDYKRYTFISLAIIFAFALLVYAIWGINKGYEYKDSNTYNIHFNTSVSAEEFVTYKNIIDDTFSSELEGQCIVKVTRINDDISSACKVNVYNNSTIKDEYFQEKINDVNEIIETKLNQLEESRTVRITEVKLQKAQSFGNQLLMCSLAGLILMALAFVYYLFRFELKTALCSLIIVPYSIISMLCIMILFRIPFTSTFMLPSLFSVVIGYIVFTLLFDNIRQNLNNQDNNSTNDSLVYGSIKTNSITLIALISTISLILVLLTFVLNINTLFMCISLLFAIVVSVYSAVVLPCTLWAMIYNKQNDKRLKARIKILEAREEKKNSKKTKKTDENGAVV